MVGTLDDLTVNFSEYGTKVDVVEPPADKTADLAALLTELAKLAGQTP